MVDLVRHSARRGTAAVEAALMLPIVVFLTFALLTYGWVFIRSGQINNAARQGVRVAVRADSTIQSVKDHVSALMATAGIPFDVNADFELTPGGLLGDLDAGTIVTVTLTVPFAGTDAELIPMGSFMPVPANLQSVASMSKEGL